MLIRRQESSLVVGDSLSDGNAGGREPGWWRAEQGNIDGAISRSLCRTAISLSREASTTFSRNDRIYSEQQGQVNGVAKDTMVGRRHR